MTTDEACREIFRIRRALRTLPVVAAGFTRGAKRDLGMIAQAIVENDTVSPLSESALCAVATELDYWEKRRPR